MANLLKERKEIWPGRYIETYKWEGNVNDTVFLDDYIDINSLPFPLKKVDFSYSTGLCVYIRTDTKFWRITELKILISKFVTKLNSRLIATAVIWGLAKVNPGEIPSWKSLFKR